MLESIRGYRTYAASGVAILITIIEAILQNKQVVDWLSSGKGILELAAIMALRSALGSNWATILTVIDYLRKLQSSIPPSPQPLPPSPLPPAPSGPDFNPFVGDGVDGAGRLATEVSSGVVVGGRLSEQFPLLPGSGNPLLPLIAFLLIAGVGSASTATTAFAATPKAVINGPTTGTAGELLTLDASQSEGENLKFLWRVQPDVSGRRMFRSCGTTGEVIHISTMPGTWQYTLVVSNAEGADLLTWTVTIPGTPAPQPQPNPPLPVPPAPGPGPTPGPQPAPPGPHPDPPAPAPLPPSKFGIRDQIPTWAMTVTSPNKVANAARLADASDALAAAVAAGTTSGPAKILAALTVANAAALGSDLAAWKSFGTSYSAALTGLYATGKLKTDAEWSEMLRETAAGLRMVK